MNLREKFIKRRLLAKGFVLDFVMDTVTLPNGKRAKREFTVSPSAVAVIPLLDPGHIVMVKQHRYPIQKTIYEIPAGKIDKGESALECVKRELIEETGFRAGKIKKLIHFFPSPAFCTERLTIYVATGLKPVKSSPDEDEFIERAIVPAGKVMQWIKCNKIVDAKTLIALLYYRAFIRRI